LQYLKTLEELAIKHSKNGIDVIVDMGSFRYLGKEQELVECENRFNVASADSKSSILCCYHDRDVKALDAIRIEEIHKSTRRTTLLKNRDDFPVALLSSRGKLLCKLYYSILWSRQMT
jgi:hypothetical protein